MCGRAGFRAKRSTGAAATGVVRLLAQPASPYHDLDSFQGELVESLDQELLWVRAVEQWNLEQRFVQDLNPFKAPCDSN
jgi:hypothetical protein